MVDCFCIVVEIKNIYNSLESCCHRVYNFFGKVKESNANNSYKVAEKRENNATNNPENRNQTKLSKL